MDVDFVINLIALGGTNVGKSQLIKRYLTQQFSEEYQATGLEQLTMSIRVGTATAKMQIWDFGGRIPLESDIGRKLMERGDIFLLCFSIADISSFETVKTIISNVAPYRGNAFVCLVGCKSDQRVESPGETESGTDTAQLEGENSAPTSGDSNTGSGVAENGSSGDLDDGKSTSTEAGTDVASASPPLPATPPPTPTDTPIPTDTTATPTDTLPDTPANTPTEAPALPATPPPTPVDTPPAEAPALPVTPPPTPVDTPPTEAPALPASPPPNPVDTPTEASAPTTPPSTPVDTPPTEAPALPATPPPTPADTPTEVPALPASPPPTPVDTPTTPSETPAETPADTPPGTHDSSQTPAAPVDSTLVPPVTTTSNCVDSAMASQLALDSDLPYFEVSAKTNEGVQAVFHTALIHAYKKHLNKKNRTPQDEEQEQRERQAVITELRGMIKSENVPSMVDLFSKDKLRQAFVELFKARDEDALNYLAHKDITPKLIEFCLLDFSIPTAQDVRLVREFSSTVFDSNVKLDTLLVAASTCRESLDRVVELFMDRPKYKELPPPRRRLIFRFLSLLFDTQTAVMLNYATETNLVVRLMEIVESDDAKELLVVILGSEKKWVERSGPQADYTLLEKIDFPSLLCRRLIETPANFGTTENFSRLVAMVRGFQAPVVVNLVQHDNYKFPSLVLELLNESSYAYDAVIFFSDVLLRVVSANTSLVEGMNGVINSHADMIKSLLSSESKCKAHEGLLLLDGLVKRGLPGVVKQFLPQIFQPFFSSHLSNVLHSTITGIVVTAFDQQYQELIQLLMDEVKLVDKILEYCEHPDPNTGYYGHLILMAKSIAACPAVQDSLKENEKWQKFTETNIKQFLDRAIFPPGPDLLATKQRQIIKAGGSFLG